MTRLEASALKLTVATGCGAHRRSRIDVVVGKTMPSPVARADEVPPTKERTSLAPIAGGCGQAVASDGGRPECRRILPDLVSGTRR
jgi:hypothetical protein